MADNKRPKCPRCSGDLLLNRTNIENQYYTITLDGSRISKKVYPKGTENYTGSKENLICLPCGYIYAFVNKNGVYEITERV